MRLQTTSVSRVYNAMCDEEGAVYIKHDGTVEDFNELRSLRLGYDSPYVPASNEDYINHVQGQTVCAACVEANGYPHRPDCEAKSFLCKVRKTSA